MKILKKFGSAMLALVLCASMLFSGSEMITANAATSLKSTYTKFVKQQLKKNKDMNYAVCYMYDFNKDGTKELIMRDEGNRNTDYVYTYYKGKVKELDTSGDQTGYIKGKKYIVSMGSGSYDWFSYGVYKISGGKAKLVTTYSFEQGTYKKGKETITEQAFNDFTKTVNWNLGTSFMISEDGYYSANQIGIDLYKDFKTSSGEFYIDKVTSTKITYHTEDWDWEEGTLISKGKKQTAKITKNTRFYYGNYKKFSSESKYYGTNDNAKRWLKKISMSKFLKVVKKKSNYNGAPMIKIKNGKVEVIVLNASVVG